MRFRQLGLVVSGALLIGTECVPAASPVDFEREVKPILEKRCLGCHNPNVTKGDVSLSTRDDVLGSEKALVVPGRAEESELYRVSIPEASGEAPYMPKKGEALSEAEAEWLRRWIDAGAHWPEGLVLREASKADKSWWAYQPLSAPVHDSIDAYLKEALAAEGLPMNPPAGRRELIRRATYDLTGLPPTPEAVEAFVKSGDPQAYPKLIDALLDSPHYGERWGRHWLDVVRFGESIGFERNVIIDDLWPFRDYVIESINADKPFDAFIREHLAGDVFGHGDPGRVIGSAFLVAGPYDDVGNQDTEAQAQIRANTLDEIINATGEAFLGMTLGCARCHDHKFDPISQRDYYQMYATFAGVQHGAVTLATEEEHRHRAQALEPLEKRRAALEASIAQIDETILARAQTKAADYESRWTRPAVERTGTEERFPPVTVRWVRLRCDAADSNPRGRTFKLDEFEIWSSGGASRNVALLSEGAKATGAARINEDFPGVYGPQLAIDGKFGERFIAASNTLTIELAEPVTIDRVFFSSARNESNPGQGIFGGFPADYRIEVSRDGSTWEEAAHGRNRLPVSEAHRQHRFRMAEQRESEVEEKRDLQRQLSRVRQASAEIPPLPRAWIGTRGAPGSDGPFHVFIGGNPQRRGEVVRAESLSTLNEVAPAYAMPEGASEAERRQALASWITHPDNPLTPRVLANRLWHYHFGRGIVDTPNDFGYMGGRPTHPGLLDFLARRLKASGWRLKPMHRLIMLSEAYRQASTYRDRAAAVDGDSRLLWRFPPRRLSAEEIRDTLLAIAGKLDPRMGGPGFRLYKYMNDNVSTYEPLDQHGAETFRRAVYHQNARASVVDLMTEFDQPDCSFSAPRRARTTTPLQALTMLNHPFTLDMAEALARRVEGENAREKTVELFRLAYQRAPTRDERQQVAQAIEKDGLRAVCRAMLNSSELIYLD